MQMKTTQQRSISHRLKYSFVKTLLHIFQAVQHILSPERNVFEQYQKSKNIISGDILGHCT